MKLFTLMFTMFLFSPLIIPNVQAETGYTQTTTTTQTQTQPMMCHWKDEVKLRAHLNDHIKYPATGKLIKETCMKEMPDEFSKEERDCLTNKLPDTKEYKTMDEVLMDLGLKK